MKGREPHVSKRPHGGFTLVEVLVALTILSVGLMAAYRTTALATRDHTWMKQRTLAQWVAANQLAELSIRGIATAADTGVAMQAGESFVWRQKIQTTVVPRFRRVAVEVAALDAPDYVLANAVGFVELGR